MKVFAPLMFPEHFVGYDYWGVGDLDIFYGDIDKYINEENFNDCDIFTTRWFITGHGTFYRNVESVNRLFFGLPGIQEKMANPDYMGVDERFTSKFIRAKKAFRVKYSNIIRSDGRFDKESFAYTWDNGSIYHTDTKKEFFYVHFLNTKRNKKANWIISDNSNVFSLTRRGITDV